MVHKRKGMTQSWSRIYRTECGLKKETNETTSNDLKVSCAECLRDVVMKREQELNKLRDRLEREG